MPGNHSRPLGTPREDRESPLTTRTPQKPKPLPRTFKAEPPKLPGAVPRVSGPLFGGGVLTCRGEPVSRGWSCPARSLSGPLLVYRGVNPLTIEMSDHGAPSLFLFTSNYGSGTPLPFPPSLSRRCQLPFQPFPAGKTLSEDHSGRLEFPRAGKRNLAKHGRGSSTQKKFSAPPPSGAGFGGTSGLPVSAASPSSP